MFAKFQLGNSSICREACIAVAFNTRHTVLFLFDPVKVSSKIYM